MEAYKIAAKTRDESGRKTNAMRATGQTPAVLYGFDIKPVNIVIDRNALEKLYQQAGESTVVKLGLEGKDHDVLLQDIQRDAISGFAIHADFRRIDMTKKVEAQIRIHLVGMSPAVKEMGGTLIQSLEEVEVLALPSALVREITVDVSGITSFDQIIRLKDVTMPAGIEVRDNLELPVASVQPPRSDAEMAALEGAVDADVSKVEVLTEKKDEEGAEGAAAEGDKGDKKAEPKKEAKKDAKK